jgi:tetratricopeptide (TPR) repeat protein
LTDRLRPLWDFGDLDASERRFRALLEESSGSERAEVLTQLARAQGLRGDFAQGDAFLREAEPLASESPAAKARIDLERGRLRRSGGDAEGARPLFESAFRIALDADEQFLAVDAAHMAALVQPEQPGRVAWAERGIDLAGRSKDPEVRYWLGPLFNNLGWEYYESGDYEPALSAFERALEVRERSPERPAEIEIARYAVAKALRGLGRPADAVPLLEQAIAWARSQGSPDGWFHEELAESYAALGRYENAREQARLALPLLLGADKSFEPHGERATRLRTLAGEPST